MVTYKNISKDYEELDKIIKQWFDNLCSRDGLCVAILRKAPRLIEWCSGKFYKSGSKKIDFVSEIAMPFLDFRTISNCTLIDEAIYHGTTFTKIYEMIKASSPEIKVRALPLFVSESALDHNSHLRDILDPSVSKIEDSYISFFIDTIVKRFHERIKPYDMEFPLLYLNLDHIVSKKEVEEALNTLRYLESNKHGFDIPKCNYCTETYSREKSEAYSTFTYIFEYKFNDYLPKSKKPDFAKLRINFKGNRVLIAVMSPYIIPESNLRQQDSIFTGDFAEIWNSIYEAAYAFPISNAELSYQREKSLTVMANYLLSYNNFLSLRDNILEAFNVSDSSLSAVDIKYLTGNNLGMFVYDRLTRMTHPMSDFTLNALSEGIDKMYIPYTYRNEYIHSTGSSNLLASTLEQKISNQFSAMHWDVEVNSRENTSGDYYGRLRFGESYDSLAERYKFEILKRDSLRVELHKNIDSRVDAGSVVPNYVLMNDVNPYWMRLFRSGENEDMLKDQFNRVVLFIYNEYRHVSGKKSIPYYVMQMIISLLIYNDSGKFSRLFGFKVKYSRHDLVLCPILEFDGAEYDILDKVSTSRLFKSSENGSIFLNETLLNTQYQTGNPLPSELEDCIRKTVSFVYEYCSRQIDWDFLKAEYLQNLLTFNYDKFSKEVDNWIDEVDRELDSISAEGIEKHVQRYVFLLTSMPDPKLSVSQCSESAWKCEFSELIADYNSHSSGNKKLENKLTRAVYILNIWAKKILSLSNQWITNPDMRQAYMSAFSVDERHVFDNWKNISQDNLKAEFRQMLRK